jgi:regulation of enolase protein 1 (concanavalin A-like superfamily)
MREEEEDDMEEIIGKMQAVGSEFGAVTIGRDEVQVKAISGTDAFVSPDGQTAIDRLPGARLALPDGPCALSVHVEPILTATYDAGALMLRTDQGKWAKLAFELSPQGRRTAVSVVTNDCSDDANGPTFPSDGLFLRIYRQENLTAFHISEDGQTWDLLRLFRLNGRTATIDLIAQSPTGKGCEARFTQLRLVEAEIADLRDGS